MSQVDPSAERSQIVTKNVSQTTHDLIQAMATLLEKSGMSAMDLELCMEQEVDFTGRIFTYKWYFRRREKP